MNRFDPNRSAPGPQGGPPDRFNPQAGPAQGMGGGGPRGRSRSPRDRRRRSRSGGRRRRGFHSGRDNSRSRSRDRSRDRDRNDRKRDRSPGARDGPPRGMWKPEPRGGGQDRGGGAPRGAWGVSSKGDGERAAARGGAGAASGPVKLRVHGLHQGSYNAVILTFKLRDLFTKYGPVMGVDIPVNPSNRVRGFAYLDMDAADAERAMQELQGCDFDDGRLDIEYFYGEVGDKDYRFGGQKGKKRRGRGGGRGGGGRGRGGFGGGRRGGRY